MRMKKFSLSALALAAILALSACAGPVAATETAPLNQAAQAETLRVDQYFENGTIYTVDDKNTLAEGLAVADGKIVFVGTAAEGSAYKAAAKEVVDLDGKMLMPGLIDGHIHPYALASFDFYITEIHDLDEALKTIEDYVKANPTRDSYYGFGYMTNMFEGDELTKGPKKERLDAICPDKPMYIYSFDGHSAWLNSKCMELMGLTPETPDVPGGQIIKDDATGELWGTLRDSAMSLLPEATLPEDRFAAALIETNTALNAMGYTSVLALPGNGFMPVPIEASAKLADEGKLTVRVHCAGILTSWKTQEDMEALLELQQRYSSGLVQVNTAKIFTDGVMDNESAHLLAPYSDNPENYGVAVWPEQDALNTTVANLNKNGIQAHIHAIGDAAVRSALDAIEYAKKNTPDGDYRNSMTHLQLIAPEDLSRFGALDVLAVVQPYWHAREPGYWDVMELPALGDRAYKMYPMKSFMTNGTKLVGASDFPVTVNQNPFVAIEMGVTRNVPQGLVPDLPDITDMDDPNSVLWPEERVSVTDMIRAFTINGAYAIFAEDETGSLEVGKSADMVIIDQNILTAKPLDISKTKVLKTYFAGKEVYSAE